MLYCITESKFKSQERRKKMFERNHPKLQLGSRGIAVQTPGPVHRFQSLLLNTTEEHLAGGDIMNQTNNLARGPDLEELSDRTQIISPKK